LVASDDRLRAEADEDVVWVFQRVAKTAIPAVPALAQVTLKKPARPLGVERRDGSTPAHARMVDEAALAVEVDDADRAVGLALDAPTERSRRGASR
jgi:hypothetical protein